MRIILCLRSLGSKTAIALGKHVHVTMHLYILSPVATYTLCMTQPECFSLLVDGGNVLIVTKLKG